MTEQERWMAKAIELAVENARNGAGGPFAAIVVRAGEPVACGTNLVTSANDPTAHAEVVAIRRACEKLGTFQLTGCEIYASCEPCPMCLGAIYWARPERVYFAATRHDAALAGFDDELLYQEIAVPPERRLIEMRRTGLELALRPFEEWGRKPDKVPY